MENFNSKLLRRLARMEGKIRFGHPDEVAEDALAQFYDQMFPERASFLKKHWRWLYQVERENAIPSPLLAIAGDQVVGHGGLIQVTLQRGDEQRDAIWMTDFAVLPEYQRGIVGGGLVQIGMSLCSLRVAFLNERSWHMVSKMGWQTHFQAIAFQLPLHPEKLPRVQSLAQRWAVLPAISRLGGKALRTISQALTFKSSRIDAFPASRESLMPFTQARSLNVLCAPRSAEFLHWRVLSHPHANQYVVLKSIGKEGCQAIARVMAFNGHRRLHLLALQVADNRALSGFFAGVIRWALDAEIDNIILVTSDPEVVRIAARWLPIKSGQRFASHAEDSAGQQFLNGKDQLWELLDSDFEMMFESEG